MKPASRADEPTGGPCGWAAVEREGSGVDDRFVAVIERVQPVRRVERQPRLGRAEDRDPPVTRAGARDESADDSGRRSGGPIGIAGDDRDAAHDAVGEEGRLVVREEVRLVRTQDERRERVRAPGAHERARELAFALGLHHPMTPRREPAARRPRPSRRHRAGAARAGTSRRTCRPSAASRRVEPEQPAQRLAEREGSRERLVGRHPVQPERRAARRGRSPARDGEPLDEQVLRSGVAGAHRSRGAEREQREHDRRDEGAVVETV